LASAPDAIAGVARHLKPGLLPALVGLVLVAPSIAWAAIDRSIWEWDQSAYGSNSIGLWATLRLTPGSWWDAMTHSLGYAPPVIVWLGQFFVPFRHVLGADEAALLLAIEAALVLAIALLFAAGLRLTDGRRLPALAGALAAASAPLLVDLSHWFLVEPIQSLSVVWVLFVMVSARSWHLSLTIAQLGAAISFGLLAKLSTPAYVAAPTAVALLLSLLATRGRTWPRWWLDRRFLGSAALMAVLGYATAEWYRINFQTAWDHAELSSTSTFWGRPASFVSTLSYWLHRLRDALFLPYFDVALGALLLAGALVFLSRGKKAQQLSLYPVLVLIGCLGVAAPALLLLASQINQDRRFVVPALPAIALGLVAVLRILDNARITGIVVLLFAGQFALMTLRSFDVVSLGSLDRPGPYHTIPVSKSAYAEQLDDIVRRTCTPQSAQKYNTVGGSYVWLNANILTMLVAEQFALRSRQCFWAGLDNLSTDNEPGTRWKELVRRNSPYFLTVDYGNPSNRLPPALPTPEGPCLQVSDRDKRKCFEVVLALDRQLNAGNADVLRRAIQSGRYVVVPGSRRLGLVLMRLASP
jgi:hypothetical protein